MEKKLLQNNIKIVLSEECVDKRELAEIFIEYFVRKANSNGD